MTNDKNSKPVDYKDIEMLKKHLNAHGRISAKRHSDVSAKNQREIAEAVKRARFMALLPYVSR